MTATLLGLLGASLPGVEAPVLSCQCTAASALLCLFIVCCNWNCKNCNSSAIPFPGIVPSAIPSWKEKNDSSLRIDGKELQEKCNSGNWPPGFSVLELHFLQFILHGIAGGVAGNAIQVQFQGELQFPLG